MSGLLSILSVVSILLLLSGVEPNPGPMPAVLFKPCCKLCRPAVQFGSVQAYVRHCILHKNVPNVEFHCCFVGCAVKFRSVSGLRTHMSRNHMQYHVEQTKRYFTRSTELRFHCSEVLCGQELLGLRSFLDHLRMHIGEGMHITCPFSKCGKKIDSKPKFSLHLHRMHRNWCGNLISSSNLVPSHHDADADRSHDVPTAVDNTSAMNIEVDTSEDSAECQTNSSVGKQDLQKLFTHNLALFYLKLQAKYLVPVSTIQMIVKDFQEVHAIGQAYIKNCVKTVLQQSLICTDAETVIQEIDDSDLLNTCNIENFQTAFKRKTFYEKNFQFVSPQKIFLGIDKHGKKRFCQYIPILQTLRTFVAKYSHLFESYTHSDNTEILCDMHDGLVCKENALFGSTANVLKILLYQDSFQVVNPLGSASTKHKLLGIYFTLANLPACYRSSVDHIQLVMLCSEQDVKARTGLDKVLARIVNDIRRLETDGLVINDVCYKGSLLAVTGDNLGSHFIGGFVENFSVSEFFCRFCHIARKDFHEQPYRLGSTRTSVTYDNDAKAASDARIVSGRISESVRGVKFRSELCRLNCFHVCSPGLPPCLAHDLFEGIISVDMALFIAYFVNEVKWFTYKQLNHAISQFQYVGSDSSSKPCEIPENASKLTGQAVQNWCFLRLFPLFVLGKVADYNDKVWQLTLRLRQLTELVCAPRISRQQIAYLLSLIEEYVYDRSKNFPNQPLKPKHHYLCHYPSLILKFGPLIHLWTLRFESKHSYFKRCARVVKNFRNLSFTLAQKHQQLQAYYSAGSLFREEVTFDKCTQMNLLSLRSTVKEALIARGISIEQSVCTPCITLKGTTYKGGQFVVLQSDNNSFMQALAVNTFPKVYGEISLIIQSESGQVFFVVEENLPTYIPELHLCTVVKSGRSFCIAQSELQDYHPLYGYCLKQAVYIPLHHSVC